MLCSPAGTSAQCGRPGAQRGWGADDGASGGPPGDKPGVDDVGGLSPVGGLGDDDDDDVGGLSPVGDLGDAPAEPPDSSKFTRSKKRRLRKQVTKQAEIMSMASDF